MEIGKIDKIIYFVADALYKVIAFGTLGVFAYALLKGHPWLS